MYQNKKKRKRHRPSSMSVFFTLSSITSFTLVPKMTSMDEIVFCFTQHSNRGLANENKISPHQQEQMWFHSRARLFFYYLSLPRRHIIVLQNQTKQTSKPVEIKHYQKKKTLQVSLTGRKADHNSRALRLTLVNNREKAKCHHRC